MRALLHGERAASPLMMGALLGMSAVALAALILAVGYRSQFSDLKHVIYTRCQQRATYDEASQQARASPAPDRSADIAAAGSSYRNSKGGPR